jgi:hypothetical protein
VSRANYLVNAAEHGPEDADVRLKLGSLFLLGGRLVEARQHATVVIEKDPKNFDGRPRRLSRQTPLTSASSKRKPALATGLSSTWLSAPST